MSTVAKIQTEIKSLIADTIDLYQERKHNKKLVERIYRGRSPSISNQFEERFASLLAKALPVRYSFFIDYPLSYGVKGRRRKKTSYPDISIIRDGKYLAGIVDLKIDLGYLRKDWVKTTSKEIAQLRKAKEVTYNPNVGLGRKFTGKFQLLPNLPRAIIVLAGANHPERLPEFLKQPNCFVLSKNVHPNSDKINGSSKQETLKAIFSDKENLMHWKKFGNFLIEKFIF